MKAGIERFEAVKLLPHGVSDPARPPSDDDLDRVGQQAQHALLPEAPRELADRVRMGVRFPGPLRGRAIGQQHQGTDDLIAPLGLIHEAQLQLCKRRRRLHRRPFPRPSGQGAYVAHRTEAVTPAGRT